MRAALVRVSVAAAVLVPAVPAIVPAVSAAGPVADAVNVERDAMPVVLTGAQLPAWSRISAEGLGKPYPSGAATTGDAARTAHNGRLVVPPDARKGANVDQIAAYRWASGGWQQVPVQVDQRFPYFLANGRAGFSTYSGTDEELTYAWAPDAHSVGEEAWKKVFGECAARYANSVAEVQAAMSGADPVVTLGPQETPQDYLGAMQDPVPTLDNDDEVVFMARDAGVRAPIGTSPPAGATKGQVVTVADPLNPSASRYVYLFLRPGGTEFTAANSPHVTMQRDANADEWIDRRSFNDGDPEKVGSSNTGYGPNLPGTVCRTASENGPDGVARASTDRFPRDGMTISTPTYKVYASGRWMVRSHQVTKPGTVRNYGADLIARWKGRAFQQSPDSTVSLVGFEDEQVNWEANSALLGWRAGPVRAIREIWGADSGTNVTKTETYYRDADTYAYKVRVHPIPPDGLYTSWAYNPGAVTTYYNLVKPNGVTIDGVNDDTGNVDEVPVAGAPAFADVPDPTFDVPSAVDRPEQVAGPNGGLVYAFEFTGPTSLLNPLAVPYYRDDACLDDGTGDAPLQRPWPGEATTDNRVRSAYLETAKSNGAPADLTWPQLVAECKKYAGAASWGRYPFASAIGQHGIHFFVTHDTDNAFLPKANTEIAGQQWRFSVPMAQPRNVVRQYGLNVVTKLVPVAKPYLADRAP